MLRVEAPAKINLFLHIGERRPDGYHALQSLVCFSEAGDVLTFEPSEVLSLSVNGPFAAGLAQEGDNLILRAARGLLKATGAQRGAAITLTKNLPVASGIGGGSADAAATLRGLARMWNANMSIEALEQIALSLGSDVPVCVKSGPAIMEGRGERITATGPLPSLAMLLVNPGVAVSTAEVFRRLGRTASDTSLPVPRPSQREFGDTPRCFVDYLVLQRNDMEPPARAIAPAIGDVLDALRAEGALLARMCGSGATCYGLFEDDTAAAVAGRAISTVHPFWWVQATRIAQPGVLQI